MNRSQSAPIPSGDFWTQIDAIKKRNFEHKATPSRFGRSAETDYADETSDFDSFAPGLRPCASAGREDFILPLRTHLPRFVYPVEPLSSVPELAATDDGYCVVKREQPAAAAEAAEETVIMAALSLPATAAAVSKVEGSSLAATDNPPLTMSSLALDSDCVRCQPPRKKTSSSSSVGYSRFHELSPPAASEYTLSSPFLQRAQQEDLAVGAEGSLQSKMDEDPSVSSSSGTVLTLYI